MTDDLRGSTPMKTAREVLLDLSAAVEKMDGKLDTINDSVIVLVSQDLPKRVTRLETFKERAVGLTYASGVLALLATILSIINMVANQRTPAEAIEAAAMLL